MVCSSASIGIYQLINYEILQTVSNPPCCSWDKFSNCSKVLFLLLDFGNDSPKQFSGFPWWLSNKESACRCRRLGFDPWFGKIPWRRAWLPTPAFLPGKPHGKRSLKSCSSRGCKEWDMTHWLNNNNKQTASIRKLEWANVWHKNTYIRGTQRIFRAWNYSDKVMVDTRHYTFVQIQRTHPTRVYPNVNCRLWVIMHWFRFINCNKCLLWKISGPFAQFRWV